MSNNHSAFGSSAHSMRILDDINKKIKNFSDDIKRLQDKITYLKDTLLYSPEEQYSQNIIKAFEENLRPDIEKLAQYLREQEEIKKEALLLETEFLDLLIKVINSIIKFQQMLDSLYPDASKKIIDAIDHFLIALLATHMPIVALVVKVGRDSILEPLVDRIKSAFTSESLTKIQERWHNKAKTLDTQISDIKNDKSFQQKYQTVKQIVELSEETKGVYTPVQIAEPHLPLEELQKCNRKKLIELFKSQEFIQSSAASSPNKITEVIDILTKEIKKILNNILGNDQELNNSITKASVEIKENFHRALDPKHNIYDRIKDTCIAVTSLFKLEKLIKDKVETLPGGQKIIADVGNLIKSNTKTFLPASILAQLDKTKTGLEAGAIIGENFVKTFFNNKTTEPSNSRGRV
ncbi:hypothetical protein [Candidatus Tisiphia endosymbiont of Nemotelus uliginosus]|uniref:hypothetical protein n=1 Tax=Candidatus Tisiphia endosymbiont of Nemotelus uliginosus TaxID=3077926 RepID=UPI0035C8A976